MGTRCQKSPMLSSAASSWPQRPLTTIHALALGRPASSASARRYAATYMDLSVTPSRFTTRADMGHELGRQRAVQVAEPRRVGLARLGAGIRWRRQPLDVLRPVCVRVRVGQPRGLEGDELLARAQGPDRR